MPRTLFASHPECFVEDNRLGRIADYNFCPSSETALEIAAERAVKFAERLPATTKKFFFWGDDAKNWCHCERCAALSVSDQQLLVANHLARVLGRKIPGASVAYLAYCAAMEPPDIAPEENVFLEFAPWYFHIRCPRHGIADPHCAENRTIREKFIALTRRFPLKSARVLEYWLDASAWNRGGYADPCRKIFFSTDIMRRDLEFYISHGIHNFSTFAVAMNRNYFRHFGDGDLESYATVLNEFI